jgi:hypothetical protein
MSEVSNVKEVRQRLRISGKVAIKKRLGLKIGRQKN